MMQYVIELLNNLCLKHGVRISVASNPPAKDFHDFFEANFVSILPNVLRYKLYCGFIPFVIQQHPVTGDRKPMLVPIGTFSWHIRTKKLSFKNKKGQHPNTAKKQRNNNHGSNAWSWATPQHDKQSDDYMGENGNLDNNCLSEYVVQATGDIGIPAHEIHVINLLDPMLFNNAIGQSNGRMDSGLGQALYSPLYVALQKYLALDLAQQRRCYADDWNTTARLFTTKHPPNAMNERAGRDEIPYGTTRFQQAQMPEGFFTYDNMKLQYQNTSSIVRDALEQTGGRGSEHVPSVYSLPENYNLVQQPELKPLMDIDLLQKQYRVSIAQSLGLPLHLIDSDTGTSRSIGNDDLPFSSEMVKNTCESLTKLMGKVLLHMYSTVYHEEKSRIMGPVPTSSVRFMFETEELYSESMRLREDERVRLQKATSQHNTTGSTERSDSVKNIMEEDPVKHVGK
jgi:hypothetical protein